MRLGSLEIRNFKSLANFSLNPLSETTVIIGRNNVGKSSIFNAVQLVSNSIFDVVEDYQGAITNASTQESIGVNLIIKLSKDERIALIRNILSTQNQIAHLNRLIDSEFASSFEYRFKSLPGREYPLVLQDISTKSEIGDLLAVFVIEGDVHTLEPLYRYLPSSVLAKASARDRLIQQNFNVHVYGRESVRTTFGKTSPIGNFRWCLHPIIEFLTKAFFFSPFRHSHASQGSQESVKLDNTGQNLASVLQTLNSNDREGFERAESFLISALPEIGRIHTTLKGQQTRVAVKPKHASHKINLSDLGGGVEQLLMIACALETTALDSALFIEEPESHLHSGAQRMLAERLFTSGRQVFITTHSPVFLNAQGEKQIFNVTKSDHRSTAKLIGNAHQLGDLLSEIGGRNSDVLLSNAVIFVEGSSDEQVLLSWLKKTGINIDERNISIIQTHGAGNISYTGGIRAQILEGISESSPIPHLFIIDRDERSDEELNKILVSIGVHAVVLNKRELENYLFVPHAIHQVLSARPRKDSSPAPTTAQIKQWIEEGITSSRQTVLLKRIRSNVPSLKGGILPRNLALELKPEEPDFAVRLKTTITDNINRHLTAVDFEAIVNQITDKFKDEWQNEDNRYAMAAGADVLDYVFKKAGYKFDKCSDAHQIAEAMTAEDIHPEIKTLCERIKNLVKPTTA